MGSASALTQTSTMKCDTPEVAQLADLNICYTAVAIFQHRMSLENNYYRHTRRICQISYGGDIFKLRSIFLSVCGHEQHRLYAQWRNNWTETTRQPNRSFSLFTVMDYVAHLVFLWGWLKMFCIQSEKQMASCGRENRLVTSIYNETKKKKSSGKTDE